MVTPRRQCSELGVDKPVSITWISSEGNEHVPVSQGSKTGVVNMKEVLQSWRNVVGERYI